jgi:hypothetical protein
MEYQYSELPTSKGLSITCSLINIVFLASLAWLTLLPS